MLTWTGVRGNGSHPWLGVRGFGTFVFVTSVLLSYSDAGRDTRRGRHTYVHSLASRTTSTRTTAQVDFFRDTHRDCEQTAETRASISDGPGHHMPPWHSRRLGKRPRPASPDPLKRGGRWTGVDWEAFDAYLDWSMGPLVGGPTSKRNKRAAVIQRRWARYTKRQAHLRSLFGFSNHFDPYDSPG